MGCTTSFFVCPAWALPLGCRSQVGVGDTTHQGCTVFDEARSKLNSTLGYSKGFARMSGKVDSCRMLRMRSDQSMKLHPVMRTDEHHQQKHKLILQMGRERKIDVVFLGDSLTRRWEDNAHLWDRYFAEFNPANFGVGADRIENVLWRVLNGEIDGIDPQLFLVLIGTNNLSTNTDEDIVDGILQVIEVIRSRCPEAKIVLFGLLPREQDETGRECVTRIRAINHQLEQHAQSNGFIYECFGDALLADSGRIDKFIMPDGLHLNEDGYRIAGPIIREIIQKNLPKSVR